jgi:hypothetical protein
VGRPPGQHTSPPKPPQSGVQHCRVFRQAIRRRRCRPLERRRSGSLLLAKHHDPRRQRAARRLAEGAATEQAAAARFRDDLSLELAHVAIGDRQAADRAAAMLERAGFNGDLRELRERREADGYRISDDR